MRIAVLIQGEPRFCKEFDLFLERLKGYDQADFYFYLWKKSQPISDYWRSKESILVADPWLDIDQEWAINKIQSNLPPNCNLIKLELADQNNLTFSEIKENQSGVNKDNLWKMMYSLYKVNELKTEYELKNNFVYDLVVKARPDLMLHNDLNLNFIKTQIDRNNRLVALPDNTRCGARVPISDIMAISSSKNMDIYCNLYNEAYEYYTSGITFHPETLLACHLLTYNLDFSQHFGYNIDIRKLGKTLDKEKYISNFGRWEQ